MVYQYIWKYGLMGTELHTVDGRTIRVVRPGRHNTDAGPDFLDARLEIDNIEWFGNVEVHVKASDWFRHHHDTDPAYSNVILHAVAVNDTQIPDNHGGSIAQTILTFPESFIRLYGRLAEKISSVPCENLLGSLSTLTVTDWLTTLTIERIQAKAKRILGTRTALDGDWEWTCFATLARALGFGLNGEPLEMLARSIAPRVLSKHSDNIMQLEALLLGQAGMLDTSVHIFDEYYQQLCREYFFLMRKYGVRPMRRDLWKFSKTRPQNFPTRRVALLARAAEGGFSLLSKIIDSATDINAVRELFSWRLSGYWLGHYDFECPGTNLPAALSKANIDLLVINFIAPMVYAYGSARGDLELAERGLWLWEMTDAENNRYTRQWNAAGIKADCAADSQALIELRREYCDRNRCLECRFGHALLSKEFPQRNSLKGRFIC